jgi:phosphate transport system substrate-binding protein
MQARISSIKWSLLCVCLTVSSCSYGDNDITIQGSGATFPAPLYKRWFLEYYKRHPEVRVNYQAIGSGAGIRQFEEGLPMFAATDAHPMITDKVMDRGVYLLPMTAGSIAVCYNLPGGPKEVKLSREVYPRIFLGTITSWNDPAIASDNPGVTLPRTPITVVRRADSSGTTFAFTNHLNAIHEDWKKANGGPGAGKSIEWPTGLAGRGNAGVASIIQLTPGAIGYTEFSYAVLANLSIASLQNKAGKYVQPGPESNLAALSGDNLKAFFDHNKTEDSYDIEITNPEGMAAYPIVTYTWMIVSQKYANERTGSALKQVLDYCLTDGQKFSHELHYIPLPDELAERVRATVRKIKVGSGS